MIDKANIWEGVALEFQGEPVDVTKAANGIRVVYKDLTIVGRIRRPHPTTHHLIITYFVGDTSDESVRATESTIANKMFDIYKKYRAEVLGEPYFDTPLEHL